MSLLRRRTMMIAMEQDRINLEWEPGALGIWGGEEIESTKHIRTKGFYPMKAGTYKITNTGGGASNFCYFKYGENQSAPEEKGGYHKEKVLTYSKNGYLRLLINSSNLTYAKYIIIEKML